MQKITTSAQETENFAKKILPFLKLTNTIALYGDLGSGKTTFVHGLAKALGCTDRVQSPTFVLLRQYNLNHPTYNSIYHLDLYRLSSSADLKSIDLPELIANKKNLVIIEWAEKASSHLPKNYLSIKFTTLNENKRKITITT